MVHIPGGLVLTLLYYLVHIPGGLVLRMAVKDGGYTYNNHIINHQVLIDTTKTYDDTPPPTILFNRSLYNNENIDKLKYTDTFYMLICISYPVTFVSLITNS